MQCSANPNNVTGRCDRVNLCVLYVLQEMTTTMPAYDSKSSKASAVNFLDLPAFLLARYM
jgi:hypothetical protein